MPEGEPVSLQIVHEIADREGVDPIELHPPLHSVIDAEALDALFRPPNHRKMDGVVEFTYRGYTVTIESPGTVRVTESAPTPGADAQSFTDSVGD